MSLKAAAAQGAKWSAVSAAANAAIQFVQLAILARLLSPADFGLVAIVLVILGFAQTYLDMGISAAIIQRHDTSKDQLSSLYWLNIFCGWIIFGVTVAIAPLMALLFRQPYLLTIVPLAAIIFIIGPPGAQFYLLLQKRLNFRTLACIEVAAALSGAVVAIGGALANFGVLALILGQLVSGTVSSAILVMIGWRTWRPRLRFRREDIKGYLGFGLYQMGERTLNYFGSRVDQLIIGYVLGPEALGYYSVASTLVMQPVGKINPILTRVAFPLFAQVQDQTERLKRGYLTLVHVLSAINAPLLLGCAAVAPIFIPLVYGPKWGPSIALVQVLAGVGLLRAIINPIGTLQIAKGRADMGFFWNLTVVVLQFIGVPIGIYFGGSVGVAVALLVLLIGYYCGTYLFMVRILLGPCLKLFLGNTLIPVLIASVMAALVLQLPLLVIAPPPIVLAGQIVLGAIIYAALNMTLQPSLTREFTRMAGLGALGPSKI
jgi:O-antigen/teichoic acid export membrane protein